MKLVDALQQNNTQTENGMSSNSSSLSPVVDLFYNIGAMRGQNKDKLISNFSLAFNCDPTRTMKILFWARDVRGGAGERQIFKDIMQYLATNHPKTLRKNLKLVPEYGRWDDLLALVDTPLQDDAFSVIAKALKEGGSLAAKWMPRKGATAAKLRNYMNMHPKEYRKTLVEGTNVVEQLMCAKRWEDIDFAKLPSVASARYQKAFWKNAEATYSKYVENLKSGKETINASAVYPYDVTKSLRQGDADVATAQWKALPNYMENAEEMILPMVDTSGSMGVSAGNNPNLTCLDVAISLGLYISERNVGPFQDTFLTFSSAPELQVLKGSLKDRYRQLQSVNWGMNTNLEAAFRAVLNQAQRNNVAAADMPDKILILSDMQFDQATGSRASRFLGIDSGYEWNPSAQEMIEKMYADAGYKMPSIVYWNLNARNGDVPVAFDKLGTALISGFSPAILTSLLDGAEFTPEAIMDKTIFSDRYAPIYGFVKQ